MSDPASSESFQYAVIRVVPRVPREEFINAGVVLFCRTRSYLEARVSLSTERLAALSQEADYASIKAQLDAYVKIADADPSGGPVARLSQSERYHWLTAPSSTVVQTSQSHGGVCFDPSTTLGDLMDKLVG